MKKAQIYNLVKIHPIVAIGYSLSIKANYPPFSQYSILLSPDQNLIPVFAVQSLLLSEKNESVSQTAIHLFWIYSNIILKSKMSYVTYLTQVF